MTMSAEAKVELFRVDGRHFRPPFYVEIWSERLQDWLPYGSGFKRYGPARRYAIRVGKLGNKSRVVKKDEDD